MARPEIQGCVTKSIDFRWKLLGSKTSLPTDSELHIAQAYSSVGLYLHIKRIFSYSISKYIFCTSESDLNFDEKVMIFNDITIGFQTIPFIKSSILLLFRTLFSQSFVNTKIF